MSVFVYVAKNQQGQSIRDTLEAESEDAARRLLREKGYWVTSIKKQRGVAQEGAGAKAKRPLLAGFQKVKLNHLAVFCRQLATLINAGVSLVRALTVLEKQTQNYRLKEIINQLSEDVQEGMALSRAMQKNPRVFSNLFVGLVRAGEVGGVLDETLERMATFLEKDVELRRKVKSAMTYPTIVIVFATAIVIFLCTFIVPKFIALFEELEIKDFPLPTLILKHISDFLLKKWWILIIAIVAFFVAFINYIRTRTGKRHYDWLKLKVPILGPINHKVAIARFARTLGTLLNSGVPILQALDTVAGAIDNEIISKAILDARMAVREGERIADPLDRSNQFPPMVVHMISVGEETGALDQMLSKIADFYESEVDAALASLAAAIEPVLIIMLGGIVGFIVISVFLPLITIIQSLSGEGGTEETGGEGG